MLKREIKLHFPAVSYRIMKPEACLEVANKSRRQAEFYLQKGNTGRAFAHFLVALKLYPSWKSELSQQFVSALCIWGEKLDKEHRYKDLFMCYEQALEVFPDNEEVLTSLGSHLYRWGHILEACNYFRQAVAFNPEYLPAKHNLHGCCNLLVERWHYRMLNDSVRNDAYRAAINRRMLQLGVGTTVLDIGTGTGLLSLFAAEAGAEHVFACDCSPAMIQIATQVLAANGAGEKVTLINKMSNDIVIPTDIPERVSLVVTETVDAGLLGEGILQSLIHAWKYLLLSSDSTNAIRVVPESATVWMVPIECLHIARKYRVLGTQSTLSGDEMQVDKETIFHEDYFDLNKLQLIAKRDEPYDTEDLSMIPGGYRFLSNPCEALNIRFNSYEDMSSWCNEQKEMELWFECIEAGRVDALVAWFDLKLDDIITLSSTPKSECDGDNLYKASCWDQAVFPVKHPIHFKCNDKLKITVSCLGGKISINVLDHKKSDIMKDLEQALYSSTISTPNVHTEHHNRYYKTVVEKQDSVHKEVISDIDSKEINMEDELMTNNEVVLPGNEELLNSVILQEAVRFLNDECWIKALEETANYLCEKHSQISSVLDLCPFPILGLHLLKKKGVRVTHVCSSSVDDDVIKRLAELNGICLDRIQYIDEKDLSEFLQESKCKFDIIMVHPVDQSGELKENILNILPVLRSSLTDGGIMLPQRVSLWGQLLESDWLKQVSSVEDNFRTCGFNIASFINIFQVPQHLDFNLSTLTNTGNAKLLSSPRELLHISLDTDTNQIAQTTTIHAECSGKANALAYWYKISILDAIPIVCTFHDSSHVSQAAILFQPCISVSKQEDVKLLMRFYQGLIYAEHLHE